MTTLVMALCRRRRARVDGPAVARVVETSWRRAAGGTREGWDAAAGAAPSRGDVGRRRGIGATPTARHGGEKRATPTAENSIAITFIDSRDGERRTVRGILGENLLETAHANDVELEGACEGSLACSTCHVVFKDEEVFKSLGEACDDENDMLDLAYGLTATSRLGCQVTCARGPLDGAEVVVPSATRNFAVDGFKPKPH